MKFTGEERARAVKFAGEVSGQFFLCCRARWLMVEHAA